MAKKEWGQNIFPEPLNLAINEEDFSTREGWSGRRPCLMGFLPPYHFPLTLHLGHHLINLQFYLETVAFPSACSLWRHFSVPFSPSPAGFYIFGWRLQFSASPPRKTEGPTWYQLQPAAPLNCLFWPAQQSLHAKGAPTEGSRLRAGNILDSLELGRPGGTPIPSWGTLNPWAVLSVPHPLKNQAVDSKCMLVNQNLLKQWSRIS